MADRLLKTQKTFLLKLLAEGLESEEINERTAKFKPAFTVSKQNIYRYRQTRKLQLSAIQAANEESALTQGLALKENRVRALKRMAALLERDLLEGFLWLDEVKSIGSGTTAEVVDYEVFNRAEVESWRGLLDDIAREMGERKNNSVTINNWEQRVIAIGGNPEKYREAAKLFIEGGLIPGTVSGGDSGTPGPASPAADAGRGG